MHNLFIIIKNSLCILIPAIYVNTLTISIKLEYNCNIIITILGLLSDKYTKIKKTTSPSDPHHLATGSLRLKNTLLLLQSSPSHYNNYNNNYGYNFIPHFIHYPYTFFLFIFSYFFFFYSTTMKSMCFDYNIIRT